MPFPAFGPMYFPKPLLYPVSNKIPFHTLKLHSMQHSSLGEVCGSEYTAAAPRSLIFQATFIWLTNSLRVHAFSF